MSQTAAVLVAILMLAPQGVSAPQPTPILDNVDLMDIVIKPAYDDLQRAMMTPPADRPAWAALYQKAARLAEFENLLFIRPRATSERGSEWAERAGQAQKGSAAVAGAALVGLRSARPGDFEGVRQAFPAVAGGCNACHRAFSREAPTIRESAAPRGR
jgi:cytochrome c556